MRLGLAVVLSFLVGVGLAESEPLPSERHCVALAGLEVLAVDLVEGRVAVVDRSQEPLAVVVVGVGTAVELPSQPCCRELVVEQLGSERVGVGLECLDGRREGWLEGTGAGTRFVEVRTGFVPGPGEGSLGVPPGGAGRRDGGSSGSVP